jgi:hypothetical protein
MEAVITKQLQSYPNFKKRARISYYSGVPLEQVHVDTLFYQPPATTKREMTPILVFCDVATRFTKFYPQSRKNERILEHFKDFRKLVKARFKSVAKTTVLISDNAREFTAAFKKEPTVVHKVSTSINKAVLAEVKIRQFRSILRKFELAHNIASIADNVVKPFTKADLETIIAKTEAQLNAKAKLKPPKTPSEIPKKLALGTPVFAINMYKFFPKQMVNHWKSSGIRKLSYDMNYYYEPFHISKIVTFHGISKYRLASYTNPFDDIDYYFYEDQLRVINPKYALKYVEKYVNFTQSQDMGKL